ncbi:MAG TPA: hypothetical protein VEJ23_04375 [Solirubrobacteraceae bacterium]|nr:hypothetical protein [Solirubrobacteraceae bacterium]
MGELEEIEEVDALPVLAPEAVVRERSAGALVRSVAPSMQAAAVAAGGFVAGVAVVGLAQRRRRELDARARPAGARRGLLGRARRGTGKGEEVVQIVGTRSLLIDVHLLGRRDR